MSYRLLSRAPRRELAPYRIKVDAASSEKDSDTAMSDILWRTYMVSAGRCRCIAAAVTSVYFRPEPVLKSTTRSVVLREPVAIR